VYIYIHPKVSPLCIVCTIYINHPPSPGPWGTGGQAHFRIVANSIPPTPRIYLTCPNAHDAIPPALRQVALLDADPLDRRRRAILLGRRDARAAIPVPAVRLVVYLGDVVAGGRHDAAAVEHHARDGRVVGVRVVDGAGAEVPDLRSR
jgi:hypothetical protein